MSVSFGSVYATIEDPPAPGVTVSVHGFEYLTMTVPLPP